MAGSHLVNGIGLSSKIVPTFAVKSRLQSLQRNLRRFGSAWIAAEPQPWRGQATPLGHRDLTA